MFLIQWLFDKAGYMPKVSVETTWPFPATAKDYTPHEFEIKKREKGADEDFFGIPRKPAVKKTVKKATTRKTTKK